MLDFIPMYQNHKYFLMNNKLWEEINGVFFSVHVTVHRNKFLVIKPTRCTNL